MKFESSKCIFNLIMIIVFSMITAKCFAEYKVGGRIMLDGDYYDDYFGESDDTFESELRSAQLYFKATAFEYWKVKIKLALNKNHDDVDIDDLYVRYTQWSFANITLGKAKEPFGMENLISSANLLAIERSMVTSAISPGRSYGLNLGNASNWYSWSVGVYQIDEFETEKNGSQLALTGRVTYNKTWGKKKRLHLGTSFSLRDLKGADYEIESKAGVHTASDVIDTKNIKTDSINQIAVEAAWVDGRFSLLSEVFFQEVLASLTTENADYGGYYIQAGYFLTSSKRGYSDGGFDAIKSNGNHAWELVTRYDLLDAASHGDGDILENSLLGINYYYGEHAKLMLNFIQSHSVEADGDDLEGGRAVSLRAQYLFF